MELTKTESAGIEKFEQLQKSVTDQISVLTAIQITDDTSLAIANQQLSKAKQLENFIDEARLLIQEKEFKFCKEVNAKAKLLATPLSTSMDDMKSKMLTFDKAEKLRKQKEAEAIAAKQREIEQEQIKAQQLENEKVAKLQEQIIKFEKDAFKHIHESKTMEELSNAYSVFVLSFPKEYGEIVLGRIKSLGQAKAKVLSPDITVDKDVILDEYVKLYASITGTEVKIEAKVIETPMAIVNALEEQKQAIAVNMPVANIRKTWDFKVAEAEDMGDIPLEWLMLNETVVKEWMKNNKEKLSEGMKYWGVTFYQRETIITK